VTAALGNPTGFDERSRWIDLAGPLHYMDFGGLADGPLVVAVHGLGGAAMNFSAVAPFLTDRCRMLAPDLAGHGLTQSLGRSTTVGANRRLLHSFLQAVADRPVILMGNSMGGMVALLEAGAAPQAVAGLILLAPAVPFFPALPDPFVAAMVTAQGIPMLGRIILGRRRTLAPDQLVHTVLRFTCVDPSRVPAKVVAEHVELARRRIHFADLEREFLIAARSVVARAAAPQRTRYRTAIQSIHVPVLLVHGARDLLVPVAASLAIARRHPSWRLVVLPDIGHVPQLESPEKTAEAVLDWLEGDGHAAASAASRPMPTADET
jgi:pimeloyl-ACP methyl ester carboxylesterase